MLSLVYCLLFVKSLTSVSYYVSTSLGTTDVPSTNSSAPSKNLTRVLLASRGFDEINLCGGDIFFGQYRINMDNITVRSYNCKGDSDPAIFTSAIQLPDGTASTYNGKATIEFDLASYMTNGKTILGFWYDGYRYLPARYPNWIDPLQRHGTNESEFRFLNENDFKEAKDEKVFFDSLPVDPDLPQLDSDYWTNAIFRHRESNWGYSRARITRVSGGNFVFNRAVKLHSSLGGFFIENKQEELDHPGEFYYNATTKILTIIPFTGEFTSLSPDQTDIGAYVYIGDIEANELTGYTTMFRRERQKYEDTMSLNQDKDLNAAATLTVVGTGMTIENISVKKGLVGMYIFNKMGGNPLLFQNLVIGDILKTGVYNLHERLTIRDSLIHDADVNGIRSFKPTGWVTFDRLTVKNIGLIAGYQWQGAGIWCISCAVVNSIFDRMGYAGVFAHGSTYVYNTTITNSVMTLSDAGAVYTKGPSTPNLTSMIGQNNTVDSSYLSGILCNFFSSKHPRGECAGIYQDNNGHFFNITQNTIDRSEAPTKGCLKLYSTRNNVTSNKCINSHVLFLDQDTPTEGNYFDKNVFESTTNVATPFHVHIGYVKVRNGFVSFAGNDFACPPNRMRPFPSARWATRYLPLYGNQNTNFWISMSLNTDRCSANFVDPNRNTRTNTATSTTTTATSTTTSATSTTRSSTTTTTSTAAPTPTPRTNSVLTIGIPSNRTVLSLCEVQVIMRPGSSSLTLNGTTASSIDPTYGKPLSVLTDGRTDCRFSSGGVTYSRFELSPWIKLEYNGNAANVQQVIAHARIDTCCTQFNSGIMASFELPDGSLLSLQNFTRVGQVFTFNFLTPVTITTTSTTTSTLSSTGLSSTIHASTSTTSTSSSTEAATSTSATSTSSSTTAASTTTSTTTSVATISSSSTTTSSSTPTATILPVITRSVLTVGIPSNRTVLSLCEVQIIMKPGTAALTLSATTASSIDPTFGKPLSVLTDGRTDCRFSTGGVTHSRIEVFPWVKLDYIGNAANVQQVIAHARTDACCIDRNTGITASFTLSDGTILSPQSFARVGQVFTFNF